MEIAARRRTLATITASALLAGTIFALPQAATAAEVTGSISGTVTSDVIEDGDGWVTAYQVKADQIVDEFGAPIAEDGTYSVTDLPAGTYRLAFTDSAGWYDDLIHWQEWWNDSTTFAAATGLELSAGASLLGIDADLESVSGKASYPVIQGKPAVGTRLTAYPGVWPAGAQLDYEWYVGGDESPVATTPSFTPTSAQLGEPLSVVVYAAIDPFGTASSTHWQYKASYQTSAVVAGTLTAATPTVSGTAAVGSTLKANPGSWTKGTSLAYQWYADGKAISKATAAAYKATSAVAGKALSVKVTGKKAGYKSLSKASKATAKVTTAGTPTVSGSAVVGATLTVKAGTWTKGASLSYQWYADGKAISKATKSAYKVTSGAAGKPLTVKVTGKKAGYATVSKTSKATAKVTLAGTPAITGTAQVGKKLTAKAGSWTSGTSFSYRWYANGKAISKATKSTYTVASSVTGKALTVKVTGKKSGHTTVSKTSKATAKVKAAAKKPSSKAAPISTNSCPKSHPIKGNQTTRHTSDWIYHVPGGQYYGVTNPEECFATEGAAQRAGYRASMR
ncbi:hypothetical protein AB3M83_12380 [Microbacterium sp. 179-B 1A2 NHS]|uniref:sunset domain-containing protein n=1 Tax=Microbacterium sp. 179-B 1A2 NHS TaxID=3142383 RepID=UPI0039A10683